MAKKKCFCSEGCGRELWPHEDTWCGICSGADDETTRPEVGRTNGPVGVFVMPVGAAPVAEEQR